jgi:hypothetical protein
MYLELLLMIFRRDWSPSATWKIPGWLRPLVLYQEVLLMISRRGWSPLATWNMHGCLRPLVLYLEELLMIFSTRLESSSSTEKFLLLEATSPIPGGVADDLLVEAGVQHRKILAA